MSTQIARETTINKSISATNDADTRLILQHVRFYQKPCMPVINLYSKSAEAVGFTNTRRKTIDQL